MTNAKTKATPVEFEPMHDQVLLKMDVKKRSILEINSTGRPTVLPSGIVIATGDGIFIPGSGWQPVNVKPGDHVAVSMEGSWVSLPLSSDPDDIYVTVSSSLILGKLKGADAGSAWFAAGDDARVISNVRGA